MGWMVKQLGAVASVAGGSAFPKKYQGKSSGKYPFFKVSDMNASGNEVYMNHAANYVDDDDLATMKAKYHPAGTIVFPKVGGAIVTNKKRLLTCDAFFDNNVMGVSPKSGLSSEFIYKFFLSLDLYDLSNKAALPSITGATVQEIPIPLPPIPEQQRIVAILDQAFADIEKARANAEKNLKNARELFDSYLNQVFSQRGEGWVETTLASIAENLDSRRVPITKSDRTEGEYPYYGASGIVDYVSDFLFDEELLLISEDGANLLARTYPIAFAASGKYWVNNHAHVLRFKNSKEQKFIEYYLNSISLAPFVSGMAQPKLNQKSLNNIPVPMARPMIVDAVVGKLDVLAMEVEKLEGAYKNKLAFLDELKKSLLQKAFSGELTKTEGHAA